MRIIMHAKHNARKLLLSLKYMTVLLAISSMFIPSLAVSFRATL